MILRNEGSRFHSRRYGAFGDNGVLSSVDLRGYRAGWHSFLLPALWWFGASTKCDTTSETCPYLLLQKAKGITLHLALPPIQVATLVPLPQAVEHVEFTAVYLPDVSGLYLRNRVLLI